MENNFLKSDEDKEKFINTLINPPEPNEKLKEAYKSYKLNDIKKVLYKEKPIAKKIGDVNIFGPIVITYEAVSSLGKHKFNIPLKESENFKEEEPSQLLIRWLVYDIT